MEIKGITIKCPQCNWQPDGKKHWICSCGHVWNTFSTAGNCPSCKKVWEHTQCPGPGYPGGCGVFSKHEDWYIIPINFDKLFEKANTFKIIYNGESTSNGSR